MEDDVFYDDEAPELTRAELAEMRPARDVHGPGDFAALTAARRGRPKSTSLKVPITIRLDPETAATFRSLGRGWQSRLSAVLTRMARDGGLRSAEAAAPDAERPTRPRRRAAGAGRD